MILVDHRRGSNELRTVIQSIGIPTEKTELPYGDFAFEGKGQDGIISIGVERKTLNDMLTCIEDARYNEQRDGMSKLYKVCVLALEGMWEPGRAMQGILMQGFKGGQSWGPLRTSGSRYTLYSKLYRYLISVSLSGVIITLSNNIYHTAFNICELYQYFQKPWHSHTSLLEIHKVAIPTLNGRPSLCRKWANDITDIGVKFSQEAESLFKTPIVLAKAGEADWTRIRGIGTKTARQIVKEVNGW